MMIQRISLQTDWRHFIAVIFMICMMTFALRLPVYAQGTLALEAQVEQSNGVLLQWKSASTEDCFQILKSTDGGGSYSIIASLSGQAGIVKCYDQEVKLGKTYWYKVVQLSETETVEESVPVKVKIALPSPSGFRAKVIKKSRVQLTWNKVDRANYYTIYRSTKRDSGYKKLVTTKLTSYTDYQVSRGTTYYYRMVAGNKKNKSWKSQKSEVVRAHLKLTAPSVTSTYAKGKMRLTWGKVNGADFYYVYKKNAKGKFELVKKTSKLYYKDSKVKKGKVYIYKVLAVADVEGKMMKGDACKPYEAWATEIDPNKKMIALTYDDGPGIYTEDIVQCLKENQAKATFFVLGCNVDAHKQALIKASKLGCEIGNHTYQHPILTRLSNEEIKREMDLTDKVIEKAIGKKPTLMRPPGGGVNDRVAQTVGKPIILWSIDTRDWEHRNSSKTVQSVVNEVQDGDIILMHDIHKSTRDASLILIPQLRRMGYQMVTVSELSKYRSVDMQKGRTYHSFRKNK